MQSLYPGEPDLVGPVGLRTIYFQGSLYDSEALLDLGTTGVYH